MITVKVTYKSNVAEIKSRVHAAAFDTASEEMYQVLKESQDLVPLDKGPLQESGTLTVTKKAVIVSYGRGRSRKYAVDQHENMMYRHLPGRQAKYLEQPFRARAAQMLARITDSVKDSLK